MPLFIVSDDRRPLAAVARARGSARLAEPTWCRSALVVPASAGGVWRRLRIDSAFALALRRLIAGRRTAALQPPVTCPQPTRMLRALRSSLQVLFEIESSESIPVDGTRRGCEKIEPGGLPD